jgi:hypothetical protein
MNLETYQNGLLHLVTGNALTIEDAPYLQSLVDSQRLHVVREVICYWRAYGLEGALMPLCNGLWARLPSRRPSQNRASAFSIG